MTTSFRFEKRHHEARKKLNSKASARRQKRIPDISKEGNHQ